MLYKLRTEGSSTTFVPVNPTSLVVEGYVEKVMEEWLAQNPYAVLPDEARVLVIGQERPFDNLTDILALDEQGNLVVIEVKRGRTPRDVIAQALEYAADVAAWDSEQIERRAIDYFRSRGAPQESLAAAYSSAFGAEENGTALPLLNRRQRVLIVGESIEPKIANTARWLQSQGVSIGCISYTLYRTEEGELFLDFQEEVAEQVTRSRPLTPSTPSPNSTATELLSRAAPEVQALYNDLKAAVSSWSGCEVGATNTYLYFRATRNFAEIYPGKSRLVVYVRPEGLDLAERERREIGGLAVERVPDTRRWTLNHKVVLESQSDLPAALRILKQSYDAVHG